MGTVHSKRRPNTPMSTYVKFSDRPHITKRDVAQLRFRCGQCRSRCWPVAWTLFVMLLLPVTWVIFSDGRVPPRITDTPSGDIETTRWRERAAPFLGAGCNAVTGDGCNPHQFPGAQYYADYKPGNVLWRIDPVDTVATSRPGLMPIKHHTTIRNMVDYSANTAESFGLEEDDVPVAAALFGGTSGFRDTYEELFTSDSKRILISMDLALELFTVASRGTNPEPSKRLRHAFERLPGSIRTGRDMDAYASFFRVHGTHFVSSVTFGAVVHSHAFIDLGEMVRRGTPHTRIKDGQHTVIANMIGMDGQTNHADMQESMREYAQLSKRALTVVNGGDLSLKPNITQWARSVTTETARPIRSKLTFVGMLAPRYQHAILLEAYKTWVRMCPSDSRGQCGGTGVCSLDTRRCTCPPGRKGSTCQTRDCIGGCINGFCDTGTSVCHCDPNWSGITCQQRCGTFVYDHPGLQHDKRWLPVSQCGVYGQGCGAQSASCFCQLMHTGTSAVRHAEDLRPGWFDSVNACSMDRCQSHIWHRCRRFSRIECAYPVPKCEVNTFVRQIDVVEQIPQRRTHQPHVPHTEI